MKRPASPLRIPEGRGPVYRFVISCFMIVMSVAIVVVAYDGIASGEIVAPHRYTAGHYVHRSTSPIVFWFCVVLYFSGGVWMFYSSIAEILYARRLRVSTHLENRSNQPLSHEMKNAPRSRLTEITSEVTTTGYFARAQERAARRKSPWNLLDLLVGLPCVALVGWTLLHLIWATRNVFLPQHAAALSAMFQSQRDQVAHVVLFIGIFFMSLPIGMLISNFIVWFIPPYRRAIEPEAKGIWHASFSDAQRDLSLVALVLGVPSLLASFVSALLMR